MIQSAKKPIIIIGGGMVGLLLARLLAIAKISTIIIEEEKPLLCWNKENVDSRVSAINVTSQRLLKAAGIWQDIRKQAYSPLIKLRVWDSLSGGEVSFDSAGIGVPALGVVVENREIVQALWKKCQDDFYIRFICPAKPKKLLRAIDFVELELNNNWKIQTLCVVGADGRYSWLREQMSIEMDEWSYEQSAIVAVVKTENTHQQIGWQVFLLKGILALLPLANPHYCAVIWSVATEKANYLTMLNELEFNKELNSAFGLRLGKIQRITEPKAIALVMRHVKNYIGFRMVLTGDAAHTIHPLAGQGINLGFMDAACLAQCFIDAHQKNRDLGNAHVLRRYERWRKGDNMIVLAAVHFFKEFFDTQSPFFIQARSLGLNAINHLNSVKNCFMKIATGEASELPSLII